MSFSAESFLSSLKPFQRDTVEYVFDRFFGADPTDRFLVADEVGLGKTMVARGVIAKLIEHHLKEEDRRIDVIYVCSNQAIARQNFSKLAIVGRDRQPITDRITTLPLHARGLDRPLDGFDRGINIIPITPTTSLDLRSGLGRSDERALLWHLLTHARLLGPNGMGRRNSRRRSAALRLLGPPVQSEERFEEYVGWIDPGDIDPTLWEKFAEAVLRDGSILEEFEEVRRALLKPGREYDWNWGGQRRTLVSRMRRILAESCVDALEPDLVILDEFQRFPRLLDPEDPAGSLAEQLFRFEGCKSLLLSATPYRMFTRSHELDETHHDDFIATTGFLMDGEHHPERVERLKSGMRDYRQALIRLPEDGSGPVGEARKAVESELRRVMCRTERLGVSNDRDGMLAANPASQIESVLERDDLNSFRELDSVARELGTRDVLEFWKSTPYPLNLMEGYALSDRFEEQARGRGRRKLREVLDIEAVRHYRRIDPANARLRGLLKDLDEREAWQQLWLSPALPYYAPGKPFDRSSMTSKRLVFSSWAVVPRAIAMLTSYHIERRILEARNRRDPIENSSAGRNKISSPLTWARDKSMHEVLYLLPAGRLGELTDPLEIAGDLRARGVEARPGTVEKEAARRVRGELAKLSLPSIPGRVNPEWYPVAILRMEERANPGAIDDWLTGETLGSDDENTVWRDHVRRLRRHMTVDPEGAVPGDLERVVAMVGIGGPGVCALRAFERVLGPKARDTGGRIAALQIGNAVRRMYDLPDSVVLLQRLLPKEPRWRAPLSYGINGNLQAVLDEYVHVLHDWVGSNSDEEGGKLGAIRDTALEALGINAVTLGARDIHRDGRIGSKPIPMRTRFALRLSDGATEDTASVTRLDSVRKAFNSPFWPFVLATTSIGQEGLDFHLYCHAIVHWNLPHNPVDLEQREGRIHRFKNHAVRRNLASDRAEVGLERPDRDPWDAMFEAAGQRDDGGIYPQWVYVPEGGDAVARIERHVPVEPLSTDRERLDELVRLLGIYRLAFGQPRQDEFLAALDSDSITDAEVASIVLNLSPSAAS
jgi:hypothetical protein